MWYSCNRWVYFFKWINSLLYISEKPLIITLSLWQRFLQIPRLRLAVYFWINEWQIIFSGKEVETCVWIIFILKKVVEACVRFRFLKVCTKSNSSLSNFKVGVEVLGWGPSILHFLFSSLQTWYIILQSLLFWRKIVLFLSRTSF